MDVSAPVVSGTAFVAALRDTVVAAMTAHPHHVAPWSWRVAWDLWAVMRAAFPEVCDVPLGDVPRAFGYPVHCDARVAPGIVYFAPRE